MEEGAFELSRCRIESIGEVKEINENFKVLSFRVGWQADPKWPQHLECQVTKALVERFLEEISVDFLVNLSCNLRGRKWERNDGSVLVFNQLLVWRWEVISRDAVEKGDDLPW